MKAVLERQRNRKERYVMKWKFTYLGDTVSAGGGCEAAVTARTRYWWAMFKNCGELLYGRRFPLMLKGAVYKSYIRPAILHGSEAC